MKEVICGIAYTYTSSVLILSIAALINSLVTLDFKTGLYGFGLWLLAGVTLYLTNYFVTKL